MNLFLFNKNTPVKYIGPKSEQFSNYKTYTIKHNLVQGYELFVHLNEIEGYFKSEWFTPAN